MRGKTRSVTLFAAFTALAVVFLYFGSILPTGRLGFAAAAALFVIAAVIESGLVAGILVFVASALLGALLLPDKTPVLLYGLFLGYYPVVKSFAEKRRSKVLSWAIKLVVFNAAFCAVWFLFKSLVFSQEMLAQSALLIFPLASVVFIVFDIGLTRVIGLYIVRIAKNVHKNKQ